MFDETQNPGGSSKATSDNLKTELSRYKKLGNHWKRYEFARDVCHDKRVLDYGCGYGLGFEALPDCREYVGVDVDGESIQWAKKNLSSKHQKCKFFTLDTFKSTFNSHYFDVILSFEVIEHVKSTKNYLSFLLQNLAEAGEIIISTPNGAFSAHDPSRFRSAFHYDEYNAEELMTVLQPLGKRVELFKEYRVDHLDSIGLNQMAMLNSDNNKQTSGKRNASSETIRRIIVGVVSRYLNGPLFYRIDRLQSGELKHLNYSTIVAIIHE